MVVWVAGVVVTVFTLVTSATLATAVGRLRQEQACDTSLDAILRSRSRFAAGAEVAVVAVAATVVEGGLPALNMTEVLLEGQPGPVTVL